MIKVGDVFIRAAAVDMIQKNHGGSGDWCNVLIRGEWISVNAPAAVLAELIRKALP
jgi:microcompartment protein CcmL/EutN